MHRGTVNAPVPAPPARRVAALGIFGEWKITTALCCAAVAQSVGNRFAVFASSRSLSTTAYPGCFRMAPLVYRLPLGGEYVNPTRRCVAWMVDPEEAPPRDHARLDEPGDHARGPRVERKDERGADGVRQGAPHRTLRVERNEPRVATLGSEIIGAVGTLLREVPRRVEALETVASLDVLEGSRRTRASTPLTRASGTCLRCPGRVASVGPY